MRGKMVIGCLKGLYGAEFCKEMYMALAIVIVVLIVFLIIWWLESDTKNKHG